MYVEEAERKKAIRDELGHAQHKWYTTLIVDYLEEEHIKILGREKKDLIWYNEIIGNLSSTWKEIRSKDSKLREVGRIKYTKDPKEIDVSADERLIEMIERIKIREKG